MGSGILIEPSCHTLRIPLHSVICLNYFNI